MPVDNQDLDTAYRRRDNDPLVSGDELLEDQSTEQWGEVVSFRWQGPFNPAQDGDYYRVSANRGPRDLPAREAERCSRKAVGSRPALRLRADQFLNIDEPAKSKLESFLATSLFSFRGRRVTAEDLLSLIGGAGYDIWLVGGAVRDLINDRGAQKQKMDFDVAGTVPFHKLSQIMQQFELKSHLNQNYTVCVFEDRRGPIIEYAPLKKEYDGNLGFNFDHDLASDVRWRDLTMNCLFYNPDQPWILDPTGKGADLLCPIGIPTSCAPGHKAVTLFRLLKFVFRDEFKGTDLTHAKEFIQSTFDVCRDDFKNLDWNALFPSDRARVLLKFYERPQLPNLQRDRNKGWNKLAAACDMLDTGIFEKLRPFCDELIIP